MNESFNLPIVFQGEELQFKARFERWGYTHRIAVLIDESTLTFEPDEEGSYRALSESGTGKINPNLLQTIAEKLATLKE